MSNSGKPERVILDVLVDHWPAAVPVETIAAAIGYSPTSGGFRNALSRIRIRIRIRARAGAGSPTKPLPRRDGS